MPMTPFHDDFKLSKEKSIRFWHIQKSSILKHYYIIDMMLFEASFDGFSHDSCMSDH